VNVAGVEVQLLGDHSRVHDRPAEKQIGESPNSRVAARLDEALPPLADLT